MKKPVFLTLFLFIAMTAPAGASEGQIRLLANPDTAAPGEIVHVDVVAENLPSVYGVEFKMTYPQNDLEPMDADPESEGVQLDMGNFFGSADTLYILQNRIRLESGEIFFAASRLNPAPAADGSGLLARLKMKAVSEGKPAIRIEKLRFGTRDGKRIIPTFPDSIVLHVEKKPGMEVWIAMGTLLLIILFSLSALLYRKRTTDNRSVRESCGFFSWKAR